MDPNSVTGLLVKAAERDLARLAATLPAGVEVERTVQVLTRRTIACGEVDPSTGQPATEARVVEVPMPVTTRCMVLEEVSEEIQVRVPEARATESPVVVRRYGALPWERPMIARRFEARLFTDPLSLPPCEPGQTRPDPVGRPESPSAP